MPLYVGASDGLVLSYDEYRSKGGFHGRDGFNDVAFDSDPDVGDFVTSTSLTAADAIRKIVNEHPGDSCTSLLCLYCYRYMNAPFGL